MRKAKSAAVLDVEAAELAPARGVRGAPCQNPPPRPVSCGQRRWDLAHGELMGIRLNRWAVLDLAAVGKRLGAGPRSMRRLSLALYNYPPTAPRGDNMEAMPITGGSSALPRYQSTSQELIMGAIFKYLIWVVAIGPWKCIKVLSWLLNKWQRFVFPLSYALFYGSDAMDKTMPTVRAIIVWAWNTSSLALHFVDVILIFVVIKIVSQNGNGWVSVTMGLLYFLSHYLMAVIMYMENDRPIDCPVYTGVDVLNFARRQVDVLFFDIQLLSSVVHSNIMIEGMTQMMLQGYEEARVCLHMIMNSLPACIILGVLYDAIFALKDQFENILEHKSALNAIYAAFLLAVWNVVDKFIRLSLADPWLHPLNEDGYPLLYMRSNAARLPRALVLDFVFRCNVQLRENNDRLTLRPLYDKYVMNCRGEAKHLADGHKMYMLRKALRTFNKGAVRFNAAEELARKVDRHITRDQALSDTRTVREVDASNIRPGPHMAKMFEEVLAETTGFDVLLLADNRFSDESVVHIVEGLRHNLYGLKIRELDLSNNEMGDQSAEAVATYIMQYKCVANLNLSNNVRLGPVGVKGIASVLSEDSVLERLDLSNCDVGVDGAAALGAMLKGNRGLKCLILANTRLGTQGIDSICKGIAKNTTLKELDISRTGCEDKAAGYLAQALQQNNTLEKLFVGNNRITDTGAKLLADSLQANTGLHYIDLAGCPMDKSWKKLLHNIMKGQGPSHMH
ncbi:hypothetical protein VOLCADRAFT_99266 [Volvox carteri f. nagariensis]|uniref:Protein NLRC3 n=1 Tax=Volvox carteri f. nagariensis TaxID=3068 RepID=D8UHD2_VOLCA|nr:uncharacterized protein VOLCADRAFT_99266 [Volvox carteri f. nagariensis]EFJ40909.1 hypothetical protein VOLCADRAFT_99266 [Volvox carteri f. nagariensis]|eukprot:XP_002958069.1 hypothetical protein VOLCADRAFT_99266 [Volvox carteri f. nagariensis]